MNWAKSPFDQSSMALWHGEHILGGADTGGITEIDSNRSFDYFAAYYRVRKSNRDHNR